VTTAQDLIRRGYFPREVPPPFTTEPLADFVDNQGAELPLSGDPTESSPHNLARTGGLRRPLRLPNPQGYVNLARVIESQWDDLDAFVRSSRITLSRPVVDDDEERALIPRFKFGESSKRRAQLWNGQRFILRTDISQFYSTLYTHSIPWALHGKAEAKRRKDDCPGGQIDKAVRQISHGQTIGIPIGPDASLLIAELVLTAVDRALLERIPDLKVFRHADDFEAAFRTRSEAETALVTLEGLLGDFELTLNPFKTHIRELPQPLNDTWPADLRRFDIREDRPRLLLDDLIALFSRAFEIKAARTGAGALKYVLHRCRSIPVRRTFWATYQHLVLSAASSEPTTMPVVIDLLKTKAEEAELELDRDILGQSLDAQILVHAPLRNGSEVAWALWASILLDVPLTHDAANAVVSMEDDLVALLALDADAKGRFPRELDKTTWSSLVDSGDALLSQHWLLAYEGARTGWIDAAIDEVTAHPFFHPLHEADVYFYRTDFIHDPFKGPAAPLPGGLLPDTSL
jgi:hypothetical protein